jgi:hypothetical protein
MERELREIEETGKTIIQYYDSLAKVYHEYDVNRVHGRLWGGYYNILSNAAGKRNYSLAAFLDSVATPAIRAKMATNQQARIPDLFARLKYKDYYRRQEEKYLHVVDSCITYLKEHPKLSSDSVYQAVITLMDCYDDLEYIGMPDVYYKLAPLLTVTNRFKHYFSDSETVGAYFLNNQFKWSIRNMPIPDDMLIEDYDKHNIPAKMYRWMMDNRDNYQLDPPECAEEKAP